MHLRFLAVAVFAVSIAQAQKPSAPAAPSGNSPGSGTIVPSAPAGPINQWPGTNIPVMLSGVVVVEGGGEPASNVAVQRVCGNIPRTMARTNARGQFSFQWNDFTASLTDASEPGTTSIARLSGNPAGSTGAGTGAADSRGLPGANMRGCEIQASAAGFRSDRLDMGEHRALDNPDLGVIVLHRIGRPSGLSISATAFTAPKDARKAWEKGMQLFRSDQAGDLAGAEREFERAVRIYPKYAQAWTDLGHVCERRFAEDRAREAFLKAVDADNKLVEPFIGLGMIASRRRQWQEAAHYLDRALQLNPVDYPHLWYDDAEADYHSGNLERAERNVREALKMPPANREPGALRLLGLVLFSRQDYAGAETALRTYLRQSPDIEDWDELQTKLAEIGRRLPPKQ